MIGAGRPHLKKRRSELGFSQRKVADLAGLSSSYYNELEAGKKRLNEEHAERIAEALNWTMADVFAFSPWSGFDERIARLSAQDQELVQALLERLER
ncbi:helix-turn-helix transcriptional regulator [Marinovum sp.]|uniref:helix-turn-helix transcriptional regulator n=1 Tax=Marinovum sp. TaxID=2024839 RepID=UPI003A5C8972